MYKFRRNCFFLVLATLLTANAFGQETLREILRERRRERLERRGDLVTREQYEEINTGEDFTKPFARTEFRYRYSQVTGDAEASFFTFRYDTPYRLESGWLFSPRFEMPFVYTNVPSRDNPNGDYEFGAGDLSTQFLMIRPPRGNWSFASGARLTWPTASQDQMGFGKYLLAPTIGASYHPAGWERGGYVGLLIRDIFDYAGKDNRNDIHELSLQPIINYNLEDFWFVTLAPDIRINWEDNNNVFLPFDISVGKLVGEDKVVAVGFSSAIVNDYDLYDWHIMLRTSWFF
jgi:hypothetical protein